jgi:hypothetical protein
MASQQDETHRTARWFKLVASDDGENWDLLLEREYQEDWKQCETRYFELENTTAYKFYRLLFVANSESLAAIGDWGILRKSIIMEY